MSKLNLFHGPKGQNIHVYNMQRGPPTKGKYKRDTHSTYISNTPLKLMGDPHNTEFGVEVAVLSPCLCLCEEVRQLKLGRHILKSHNLIMHLRSHVGSINIDVLGEFMLHRIPSNTDRTSTIRGERSWCGSHHTEILK